jgi:mercuric transport protein
MLKHTLALVLFSLALLAQPVLHAAGAFQKATLSVKTMTCGSCKQKIEASLSKVPGIQEVRIDVKKKLAVITFEPGKTTTDALIGAVKEAGFEATLN